MPLSIILQPYRGSQFYWWSKPEYMEKTTDLPLCQVADNRVHLAMSGILTHSFRGDSSQAFTLIMGRMLDLPSVIELAPCKYKRVYFYFGVQKKLITY
jgi:hypothetical protein